MRSICPRRGRSLSCRQSSWFKGSKASRISLPFQASESSCNLRLMLTHLPCSMLLANIMATTFLVHPGRPLCTIILANRPLLNALFCRHIRTSHHQPVICPRELVSFAKDAVNPPRFCRRSRPNIIDFAELLVRQALPVVVTTPIPAGLVVANYALSLYHH